MNFVGVVLGFKAVIQDGWLRKQSLALAKQSFCWSLVSERKFFSLEIGAKHWAVESWTFDV